jgi:hypothetical protein
MGKSSGWAAASQDLTGREFSRLTVLSYFGKDRYGRRRWCCRCVCGAVTSKPITSELLSGKRVSCGCARVGRVSPRRTHGRTKTKLYDIWKGIIQRCTNQNHPSYARYGARGVSICDAWRVSFEVFAKAVGHRPTTSHSLDRYPNREGNYEPGNVRWATYTQQNRNRCNTVFLTYGGVTATLMDWSERLGVPSGTFRYWYSSRGPDMDAIMRCVEKYRLRHVPDTQSTG